MNKWITLRRLVNRGKGRWSEAYSVLVEYQQRKSKMEAKWTSYLEQNIWYKVKKQSKLNRTRKLWYLQLRSFYFLNFQIFLNFSHFYFWNRHWALGYFSVGHDIFWEFPNLTLHKKWSFPLRNSSVNVTKSAVSCGFRLIYRRKTSFFVKC